MDEPTPKPKPELPLGATPAPGAGRPGGQLRSRKAALLLPLVLVVGGILATLYIHPPQPGGTTPSATPTPSPTALASPAQPPTTDTEEPASVSVPEALAEGSGKKAAKQLVKAAAAAGIPPEALAAYQRAETVMVTAQSTCGIDWALLAAIGRIESDHGRFGGNVFDINGVAQPGIYGLRLDGTNGTREILDTDGGKYDQDTEYDRAVGPMQFIPATWAVVAVDGDDDGQRNPQDIDDAALGSAVYLCSTNANLTTEEGRREAVYRYNNSSAYVDLVLQVREAYLAGNFSDPIGTAVLNPPVVLPTAVPAPVPTSLPTSPALPGKGKGKGKNKPGKGQATESPAGLPTSTATVGPAMTWLQAQAECIAKGKSLDNPGALKACIEKLLG